MQEFCKLWKISLTFRCAYKPSGSGIVERNHRTNNRMSARWGKSIDYCLFWYNITPHGSKSLIPSSKLISDEWRNPFLEVEVNFKIDDGQESDKRAYSVGNKVWVRPHGVRCTSLWNPGIVTKVNSEHNVEVDGVPRHVCDMRRRWTDEGKRDDESLISANLSTVGPNFESSSFKSNFERDAERRNATQENGNDIENESLLLPRRGLRAKRLPAHLKDIFVNDDFEITGSIIKVKSLFVNAFHVYETILLCDVITAFYESIKLTQFRGIVRSEQELFTVLVLADSLLLHFGSFVIVSFFISSFLLIHSLQGLS